MNHGTDVCKRKSSLAYAEELKSWCKKERYCADYIIFLVQKKYPELDNVYLDFIFAHLLEDTNANSK